MTSWLGRSEICEADGNGREGHPPEPYVRMQFVDVSLHPHRYPAHASGGQRAWHAGIYFRLCVANPMQTDEAPSFFRRGVRLHPQIHSGQQNSLPWKATWFFLGCTLFVYQLGAALRHGNQYHLSPCGVSSIQAIPSLRRSSKACWARSSVHCVARMSP